MNTFKMILIVLLILIGSNLFAENLITNGGFEDVINFEPTFWAKDAWKLNSGETSFYLDSEILHSGNYSVVIDNRITNDARLVQGISVKPSTYYLLSCWVRAENCGKTRRGANIGVVDPQIFQCSKDLHDTNGEWEKLTFCVLTAQKQVVMSVCVRLGIFGNDNTGKAWFDDFTLEETSDPEYISQAVRLPQTVSTMDNDGKPMSMSNSWSTGILVILGIIAVLVCWVLPRILCLSGQKVIATCPWPRIKNPCYPSLRVWILSSVRY